MANVLSPYFSTSPETQPTSVFSQTPSRFPPSAATSSFLHHTHLRNSRNLPQEPLFSSATNPAACKRTAATCCSCTQNGLAAASSANTTVGSFTVFKAFGLAEGKLETALRKSPSLQYVSAELLEARYNSLLSSGIRNSAIWPLIVKRPIILIASEVGQFLDIVQEKLKGIDPKKLERLLRTTEPKFLVGFDKKVSLLLKHGVPCEKLADFVNGISLKVLCCREIDKTERTLIFLSRYSPDLVIRRPKLLNLDSENQLIPRAAFLSTLGPEEDWIKIIRSNPVILSYTVENLEMHAQFWRSVGFSQEEIFRFVRAYPGVFSIFGASRERKLQPRIEFLKQCGLDTSDIVKFLVQRPLFLSLSFEENLSKKLVFLVKLGYKYRTKDMAMAIGATTMARCENVQMAIGVFLDYGLSCEDIFIISKKQPLVLRYNHKYLERKLRYLVEEMGRDVGDLLDFPVLRGHRFGERAEARDEEKIGVGGRCASEQASEHVHLEIL